MLALALASSPQQVDDVPEAVPDPAAEEVAPAPASLEGDAPPPPLAEQPKEASELSEETLAQLAGWKGKAIVLRLRSGRTLRGTLVSFNAVGIDLQIGGARSWVDAGDIDGVTRPALPPPRPRAPAPPVDDGRSRTLGWSLVGVGVGGLFAGGCAVLGGAQGGLRTDGDEAVCFFCGGLTSLVGVAVTACGAIMVGTAAPAPAEVPAAKPRPTTAMAY
jgi:hypothetical protein